MATCTQFLTVCHDSAPRLTYSECLCVCARCFTAWLPKIDDSVCLTNHCFEVNVKTPTGNFPTGLNLCLSNVLVQRWRCVCVSVCVCAGFFGMLIKVLLSASSFTRSLLWEFTHSDTDTLAVQDAPLFFTTCTQCSAMEEQWVKLFDRERVAYWFCDWCGTGRWGGGSTESAFLRFADFNSGADWWPSMLTVTMRTTPHVGHPQVKGEMHMWKICFW